MLLLMMWLVHNEIEYMILCTSSSVHADREVEWAKYMSMQYDACVYINIYK